MKRNNFTKLNNVTKILLILLIGVIFYFAIFSILKPFFITEPTPMMKMMSQVMGSDIMNFSTTSSATMNLVSLIVAIIVAIVTSFYLFKHDVKDEEYNIIKKALSQDEKKILDEIKKAKEITQDSLKFRLDWSKAKVSTILTNLDKRRLIQRERIGKTYKVYLQK
jgi:predicted PurR-regulated permease PerM